MRSVSEELLPQPSLTLRVNVVSRKCVRLSRARYHRAAVLVQKRHPAAFAQESVAFEMRVVCGQTTSRSFQRPAQLPPVERFFQTLPISQAKPIVPKTTVG
jgi:hypothetical protein